MNLFAASRACICRLGWALFGMSSAACIAGGMRQDSRAQDGSHPPVVSAAPAGSHPPTPPAEECRGASFPPETPRPATCAGGHDDPSLGTLTVPQLLETKGSVLGQRVRVRGFLMHRMEDSVLWASREDARAYRACWRWVTDHWPPCTTEWTCGRAAMQAQDERRVGVRGYDLKLLNLHTIGCAQMQEVVVVGVFRSRQRSPAVMPYFFLDELEYIALDAAGK
jgi:hypothetical protein